MTLYQLEGDIEPFVRSTYLQSHSSVVHCSLPHSDYQEIAVAREINENYQTFIMWHHPYALSRQLGVVISVVCSLSMSTLLEKDSTSNWIMCLYSTRSLAPPLQRLCLHKHIRSIVWGNFLCFRRKPLLEINLKHGNNDKISEVVIPVKLYMASSRHHVTVAEGIRLTVFLISFLVS